MSIRVVCTACHASFNVSDKFAGKTGPCPKCKKTIQVPKKSEQVEVHEAELEAGAKDSKGRSVLKPITRDPTKINPIIAGISGVAALAVFITAWVMGATAESPDDISTMIMGIGATLIAPPLVLLGYAALRDQEIEPFRGKGLWLRVLATSVIYVGIWGGFVLLGENYLSEIYLKFGFLVFASVAGMITTMVSLELDPGNGFFHYLLYLGVCVILRLMLGLPFI